MNLGILWPKLAPALLALGCWAAVTRVRRSRQMGYIAAVIGLMVARDIVYAVLPLVQVCLVADLGVLTLYVLWVRSYTGPRRADLPWFALNAVAAAAAAVSIAVTGYPQVEFALGLWLLLGVAYFAVAASLVPTRDAESAAVVVGSRTVLAAGLFLIQLAALLYGYGDPLIQAVVIPLSYLAPAWVCLRANRALHDEAARSIQFYSTNVDATYDFMEHLGDAITSRIDLSQVFSIIISAAVKNIGADAGAILMVDEYEDLLRVRATVGIYPPLGPAPELARMTPASLKRYFAETPIPIGETVLGQTVKTGQPVFIRDTGQDERMRYNAADDIMYCSSLAAIPLVVRDRVLGVLSVLKRAENQYFDERDWHELETLADYASITIDNLYTYSEVLEKREIEREVDIAAQIQRRLLPARLPDVDRAALAVYTLPAKGVSGDYYDVFRLAGDRIGVVICDVAGKGIPAALVMVMIRSVLQLIVSAGRDAAATLEWVNRGITGRIDVDHFATLAFLVYDPKSREVRYANAAHLPLLLHRRRDGRTFKVDTEGLPIGVEKGSRYQQKSFSLEEGDLLVLCTDGITEAMNPSGEEYGVTGLRRAVERNAVLPAEELVAAVRDDLKQFVGSARQHDDQTLLLLQAR
ncbi:MAG TPA: GAF domain-containing SpoIIE family protein phosphatase [Spirochaetia bacterium]|nr:GAF domain-containing SpoIIE family protein phosphatase [Spirochaetia bacterium]